MHNIACEVYNSMNGFAARTIFICCIGICRSWILRRFINVVHSLHVSLEIMCWHFHICVQFLQLDANWTDDDNIFPWMRVCVCLLVLLLWLILLLLLCVSLVNYFDVNVWRYLSFVGWPAKWWIQPKSEDKANICIFTPKSHNMPLSYATHTHTQTHIWVNWMCDEHIYDGEMASWMTKR